MGKANVADREPEAVQEPVAGLPDDFYDKIRPRLYRRIGEELREARHVLDLGCGGCELSRFLAETHGQQVIGVDLFDGGFPDLDEAERRARALLRCIKADGSQLAFLDDGEVDAVVTMWALHEVEEARAVLGEARRVLRPGGKLLIVDFPHGSLAQRLWNEDYYTPQQVSDLLAATGYADISVRLVERRQVLWAKGLRPTGKEPAQ
jgi:ubiquinone/menaquinone biosynthesis C-methylase UbiE